MKLNAIYGRVFVDGPGVRGPLAQGLAIRLAGSSDVLFGDCRKRDLLDRVDLDLAEADRVAATLLDPWPLPQSNRERDLSGEDVAAQLAAELHTADVSGARKRVAARTP